MSRQTYPSDVSNDEWAFVAPCLTHARGCPLARAFLARGLRGLRYIVRTGVQWRMMAHDLRMLIREIEERAPQPRAATLDSRTLQSTPESGERAGYETQPATDARAQGIRLEVVKLPEAKRGFVLLPRRWVLERSFAWLARVVAPGGVDVELFAMRQDHTLPV